MKKGKKYQDSVKLLEKGKLYDAEEALDLVKFQNAYNASSRFMTVISQMTELIVTGLI